jgi:hypothetical protein
MASAGNLTHGSYWCPDLARRPSAPRVACRQATNAPAAWVTSWVCQTQPVASVHGGPHVGGWIYDYMTLKSADERVLRFVCANQSSGSQRRYIHSREQYTYMRNGRACILLDDADNKMATLGTVGWSQQVSVRSDTCRGCCPSE